MLKLSSSGHSMSTIKKINKDVRISVLNLPSKRVRNSGILRGWSGSVPNRVFHTGTFFFLRTGVLRIVDRSAEWSTDFLSEFLEVIFIDFLQILFGYLLYQAKFWLLQIQTCLHTNQREISHWFQKCILLQGRLQHLLGYGYLKAKMGPKLGFRRKTCLFSL